MLFYAHKIFHKKTPGLKFIMPDMPFFYMQSLIIILSCSFSNKNAVMAPKIFKKNKERKFPKNENSHTIKSFYTFV